MYTIFVNERPLVLTNQPLRLDKDTKIIKFEKIDSFFEQTLHLLNQNIESSICIYHIDLDFLWNYFQNHYKVIEAAGGLVKNHLNEVLFIKRFGLWDLPKGKIEKGENKKETALREVEEECNIFGLKIIKPLNTTYHIYYTKKGKAILKIVYWYEMVCKNEIYHLNPQIEEGIEEVVWKNTIEIEKALKNTYQNIKLLF